MKKHKTHEKKNLAVREAAEKHNMYFYEIAYAMKISESQLTKLIRQEWPEEEQNRVIRLIEEYAKEVN